MMIVDGINLKWIDYYGGIRRCVVTENGFHFMGTGVCSGIGFNVVGYDTAEEAVIGYRSDTRKRLNDKNKILAWLKIQIEQIETDIACLEKYDKELESRVIPDTEWWKK